MFWIDSNHKTVLAIGRDCPQPGGVVTSRRNHAFSPAYRWAGYAAVAATATAVTVPRDVRKFDAKRVLCLGRLTLLFVAVLGSWLGMPQTAYSQNRASIIQASPVPRPDGAAVNPTRARASNNGRAVAPTPSATRANGGQVHGGQANGGRAAATLPPAAIDSSGAAQPAAGEFPYLLTTAYPGVVVRSGPGDSFYSTDRLPVGTSVQVWRHDPDGWLAIRPPEGSFSLIQGSDTQASGQEGVSLVIKDRAKAWVGTRVDQAHQPITQIRLKQGERVAVISTMEVEADGKVMPWLQIEPPAGEFRWVHRDDFSGDTARRQQPDRPAAASEDALLSATQPAPDQPWTTFIPGQEAAGLADNGMANPGVVTPDILAQVRNTGRGIPAGIAAQYQNAQHPSTQQPGTQHPSTGGPLAGRSSAGADSQWEIVDFPSLELEEGTSALGNGQMGVGGGMGTGGGRQFSEPGQQWRAAQRETPEMGFAEIDLPGGPSTSPDQNRLGQNGSRVAGQNSYFPVGFQQNSGNAGNHPADGDQGSAALRWDQALAELRQNQIGNYSSEPGPVPANQPSSQTASTSGYGTFDRSVENSGGFGVNNDAASPLSGVSGNGGNGNGGNANGTGVDFAAWNQALSQLNVSLGQEVSKSATQWNLTPLLQQSQRLEHLAPSPPQREAANQLRQRMLEFLRLQQTQPPLQSNPNDMIAAGPNVNPELANVRLASANGFAFGALGGGTAGLSNPASSNGGASGGTGNNALANPYDAVGYLKELVLQRGKQPNAFVLQDANGKTICHVSPEPGVNLHRYLDQKIGVQGTPGYHASLGLPHVRVAVAKSLE